MPREFRHQQRVVRKSPCRPAQQAEAMIETAPVTPTEQPERLRVSGRIALPDTRTWHVGVRTDGLVSSVAVSAGDLVRKGQILARYHADELREARAKYAAGADRPPSGSQSAEGLAQRYDATVRRRSSISKAASLQQVEQARQDLAERAGGDGRGRDRSETGCVTSSSTICRFQQTWTRTMRPPTRCRSSRRPAGTSSNETSRPARAVHTDDDAFVIGDLSQVWMLASVRQEQLGLLRVGDERKR